MPVTSHRALVLIDRDGTLIAERHYLDDPGGVALLPRAARALALLKEQAIARAVTTNQGGVGLGYFAEDRVGEIHDHLRRLLAGEHPEAGWDALYYAIAHPQADPPPTAEQLHQRKPSPGMAEAARRDLGAEGLPLFVIGDKIDDLDFAHNAGGTGVLVRTGHGREHEQRLKAAGRSALVADDFYDAVRMVLMELIKAACPQDATLARKLRTPGQLRAIGAMHRSAGHKCVLANGCFDLLHGGHISFLENARAAGDRLILAVNSNASIRRLKGEGRPIFDEPARLQLLAALQAVDYLTVFYTDSADEVLEDIRPDIHAKGTDYRDDNVPELQTSRRLGIRTVIAGAPKENSTRDIIEVVVERARQGLL